MQRDAESTGDDRQDLRSQFMALMQDLAQGELTHEPPFDLATSAALASNSDCGELAEKLFEVTAARDSGYEIVITQLTPGEDDPMRREVVNTQVASTGLLIALLDSVIDELEARSDTGQSAE